MATKVNTIGMLKYEDLTSDVTISNYGIATNAAGDVLLTGVRGIYSEDAAKDSWDDIVNSANSRIHGNDLELKLQNGFTVTVKDYFLRNGVSTFNYIVDGASNTTNLLNAGFIENKNKYNEYNLAENHDTDGRITKTYITGTAFNDSVDLSGFDSEQLKYANGVAINQLIINTAGGNDTITGSIVDDYITGGSGENTLDYTSYIAANKDFSTDTYTLKNKETLNINFASTPDDYGMSQIRSEKVGNNIEITAFSKEAETEEIAYEKTVVTGDNIATKYQKTVVEGDSIATRYKKYEVIANGEAETEGEHEGKYEKITKLYVRNADNDNWELAEIQPEAEWSDEEVMADTKYSKSVNGVEGEKGAEPANYNDEGKYNKIVKIFSRKDDNSDWKEDADETVPSLESEAISTSTTIKKYVNGGEGSEYTGSDFSDEGKYNKLTTIFNYNGVRDITQSDITDNKLTYIDNNTVSKAITTDELSEARTEDGYTVVAGKLHHDAEYRDVNEDDIVDGLIFVDSTHVKETEEGEARAIVAEDIKEAVRDKWTAANGIETAAAINQDLAQEDLAAGWTIAEDKTNATRALTAEDLTEAAQVYEREAVTGKLVLWDKISSTTSKVDEAVAASTTYERLADKTGDSAYAWDDNNKPTDMGTQETGKTIVNYDKQLGKVVLQLLGAYNDFASVNIDGTDIFDSEFYINAKNGGYIAGMKANETVELDKNPVIFAAQATGKNGFDSFYSEASITPNLTYINRQNKLQDLVAKFDSTNNFVWGDAEDKSFGYNNAITNEGINFNNVNATIIDKSGAGYQLTFAEGNTDLSSKYTNNLVYAEAQEANKGVSVSTGIMNDVVFFGSAANDVTSDVTATSPNFADTKLFFDGETLKYEKTAAKEAEYRAVTDSDIVDGLIFVDSTHVKETEEGEARAIVAEDIKEEIRDKWSAANGIETAAAIPQELEIITEDNAAAAINGVAGYAWDAESASIKYTTENVNKVTYTSGDDAYLGSTGKEEYDIANMNTTTAVTINDLGGNNDLINFTNKNFSDMTIFFDVNKNGEAGSAGLSFITNDIAKSNPYGLLSFFKGNSRGGVIIENFFEEGETILDADKNVLATAKGDGYIENIKVSGSATAGSIDAQIAQITQNVAAWLENNANYDSAMEVVNAGNVNDIQSLVQCYTAGTTFTA